MSLNRIQKLLLSEYCDFEDTVLIESPFAQTDREGTGIRQVSLGLTSTKLILAKDVFEGNLENATVPLRADSYVSSFELVVVYPLSCVHLSIFHRKKRYTIKVRLCTNKTLYFELGGFQERERVWKAWCEQISSLYVHDQNSQSESSVGSSDSSTSITSIYIIKKQRNLFEIPWFCSQFDEKVRLRNEKSRIRKWTDKYLFMGTGMEDSPLNYKPMVHFPQMCELICSNGYKKGNKLSSCVCENRIEYVKNTIEHINRFGSGIDEKCTTGLILPTEDVLLKKRYIKPPDIEFQTKSSLELMYLAEDAVKIWERSLQSDNLKPRRPRYGICPNPYLAQTFGFWLTRSGDAYSIQVKRIVSEISITKKGRMLRLPVSKVPLTASISSDVLSLESNNYSRQIPTERHEHSTTLSIEQKHLGRICRKRPHVLNNLKSIEEHRKVSRYNNKGNLENLTKTNYYFNNRMYFDISSSDGDKRCARKPPIKDLTRILRTELNLTIWDFSARALAYQLTLIDRDLFLNILPIDLAYLLNHKSANKATNLKAVIAFSHRVTCLVATEVLRNGQVKMRARLIARFINTAYECRKIYNFQSCKSVLNGLQIPAIYRLKDTWNYVRRRHNTQYQIFRNLCYLFGEVRSSKFQKCFAKAMKESPFYLPYVGHVVAQILGKVDGCYNKLKEFHGNEQKEQALPHQLIKGKNSKRCLKDVKDTSSTSTISTTSVLQRLLSTFRLVSSVEFDKPPCTDKDTMNIQEKEDGFSNDKKERLNYAVEVLKIYNNAVKNYEIKCNKVIREYLLCVKYEEEISLFLMSLQKEPCRS